MPLSVATYGPTYSVGAVCAHCRWCLCSRPVTADHLMQSSERCKTARLRSSILIKGERNNVFLVYVIFSLNISKITFICLIPCLGSLPRTACMQAGKISKDASAEQSNMAANKQSKNLASGLFGNSCYRLKAWYEVAQVLLNFA